MSILDLLFAEALAAGMARALAEEEKAGDDADLPDNYLKLPPDPAAWRKLHATCTKDNLVICVLIIKEMHPPSISARPHFINLAKRVPNIPFIQVKTGLGRTYNEVREDLGGIDSAPTLVIAFFDGPMMRIKSVVGEEKIKIGVRLDIIESTIKEFLEEREKSKTFSEQFARAMMNDLEKKKRQIIEEKMKKEKEELERRMKEKEQERNIEERREKAIEELRSMDLQSVKIPVLKAKMDELKIGHVGALTREDLIDKIKKTIPNIYYQFNPSQNDLLSSYVSIPKDVSLPVTHLSDEPIEEPQTHSTPQDDLHEARLLYASTLHDMKILGRMSKKQEGVVVRAKCTKPGFPHPDRVYALKIISDIHGTTTITNLQRQYKNEYDILSGLPKHENIVQLIAFFYDRPKIYEQLQDLHEGLALCLVMECLSQNMQSHIDNLNRVQGPKGSVAIRWVRDVICGLHFLFTNCVVHRDMKLENLLLSGDKIKIADFGNAIHLDQTMKQPFTFVCSRGGNDAHLAPEILNARPSPGSYLDYNKQPVWEAGVLAYELMGHPSPFERRSIDQRAYNSSSIPLLDHTYNRSPIDQQHLPSVFTDLVRSMLEFYPNDRPTLGDVYKRINQLSK